VMDRCPARWPALVARALADSSDFGLLGEQSSQKFLDADEPPRKI